MKNETVFDRILSDIPQDLVSSLQDEKNILNEYSFDILINPVAQQRSGVNFEKKKFFDQKKSKVYKEEIAWKVKEFAPKVPTKNPCIVSVIFFFHSDENEMFRIGKQDTKNLFWAVEDALTGIFWKDDNQNFLISGLKAVTKDNSFIRIRIIEYKKIYGKKEKQ